MRAYVPDYTIETPSSLEELLSLLAQKPGHYKPFAGGTDIMVPYNAGHDVHPHYLSLHPFEELKSIQLDDQKIRIGALVTYRDLIDHPEISNLFPMLTQAAKLTGATAIQNRGTLGGNIANASPAADTPPALLAYDATLVLRSSTGERTLPYQEFHTGYKQHQLEPTEIITAVEVPRRNYVQESYRKVGTRKAQAISKLCFAATYDGTQCRIGWGSVAACPVRSPQLESLFSGSSPLDKKALDLAITKDIKPIDDVRSTGSYRLQVAANLAWEFWNQIKK